MKVLTVAQVAEALGEVPITIKRHIYYTKKLKDLVQYSGRSPVFTEDQLPEIRRILDESQARGGGGTRREVRERQDRALALMREGKDYYQIAEALGYADRTGAIKAVAAAQKRQNAKKRKRK